MKIVHKAMLCIYFVRQSDRFMAENIYEQSLVDKQPQETKYTNKLLKDNRSQLYKKLAIALVIVLTTIMAVSSLALGIVAYTRSCDAQEQTSQTNVTEMERQIAQLAQVLNENVLQLDEITVDVNVTLSNTTGPAGNW